MLLKSQFMAGVSPLDNTTLMWDINTWEVDKHYPSLETASADILFSRVLGHKIKYQKRKLQFCFYENCCTSKYDKEFCVISKSYLNEDKFDLILNPNKDYMKCLQKCSKYFQMGDSDE